MSLPSGPEAAIRIEKVMRASPARVFRGFLDAELMRQWIVPDDLTIDSISVEPRVGGLIEVYHSRDGVRTGRFEGRYVKIDPPRELVYRWAFVGTEPEKGEYYDTLVTVQFRAVRSGRTHLTVIHEKLAGLREGAPEVYPRLGPGWENCLDKLERSVILGGPWEPSGASRDHRGEV
jgi:uncharacterized protein YndB with AHSA1/START domain